MIFFEFQSFRVMWRAVLNDKPGFSMQDAISSLRVVGIWDEVVYNVAKSLPKSLQCAIINGTSIADVQTGPGTYPPSRKMGTGSFLEVKRPGRGADHPPPSKCRGQERVGLYLYSPSRPSWPVMGAPLAFTSIAVHDAPKCRCRCQKQYTMPQVRSLLCSEEPVYFVASRHVNNSLRLNIPLSFVAATILLLRWKQTAISQRRSPLICSLFTNLYAV